MNDPADPVLDRRNAVQPEAANGSTAKTPAKATASLLCRRRRQRPSYLDGSKVLPAAVSTSQQYADTVASHTPDPRIVSVVDPEAQS